MQAPRPTLRDVAAKAGVAPMTVSYAFNRPSRVSDATRARVLEAADAIGYVRPNSVARALRSGRTRQLGVVVGEHLSYAFTDSPAAAFFAGIADVCVESGMGMVLIPTHGAGDREGESDVDRVLSAAVDGYVLWTTTDDDPVLAAIAAAGVPAAIQGGPRASGIPVVGPPDRRASAAVAAAALSSVPPGKAVTVMIVSFPVDHQRTAFVGRTGDVDSTPRFAVTAERLAGFRDAVAEAGLDWNATALAIVSHNDRAHGREAAASLLDGVDEERHVVVLAMSDELAVGVHDVLGATTISHVITGWDATEDGHAAGILSVEAPLREQGRLCARVALGADVESLESPWRLRLG